MASDTISDASSEYASILGAKPEKYQTKVFLFQVSFYHGRRSRSSLHWLWIKKVRNVKRLHWLEWMYFFLAIVSILATLGITIQRIVYTTTHDRKTSAESCVDWKCNPDFTFAILLIVNLGNTENVHYMYKFSFISILWCICCGWIVSGTKVWDVDLHWRCAGHHDLRHKQLHR